MSLLPVLGATERVLLTMAANGYTRRQIGDRCGMSRWTVERAFTRIFAVFDVHDMARAVFLGLRTGVIDINDIHPRGEAAVVRPFRVLVTISRGFPDRDAVNTTLTYQLAYAESLGRVMTLVHGHHYPGSDEIADLWGQEMKARGRAVEIERHPAQRHPTEDFGPWPGAGPKRNAYMVSLGANLCLAFISLCRKANCRIKSPHASHGASGCASLADSAGILVHRFYERGK